MWAWGPTARSFVGPDSCRSHKGEQMLCVGSTSSLTGWECDEGEAKQLERGGNKGRTVWALAVLLGCRNRPFGTHVRPISALRPSGMGPDSMQPCSPSVLQKESRTTADNVHHITEERVLSVCSTRCARSINLPQLSHGADAARNGGVQLVPAHVQIAVRDGKVRKGKGPNNNVSFL
jgi:hypothetical protein